MPILKLVSLTPSELIIQPVRSANSSSFEGLSQELENLKKYLKTRDLIIDVDYVESTRHYTNYQDFYFRLTFSTKTHVLRALYSIPIDQIQFSSSRMEGFLDYATYKKNLYNFALTILPKECTCYDKKFIDQACNDVFEYLKKQIKEIHSLHVATHSSVITQLNADLKSIENFQNEDVFTSPKYLLVLASLFVAAAKEKTENTIVQPYVLFKGNSILSPEYEKLIAATAMLAPLIVNYAPTDWNRLYNNHLVTSPVVMTSASTLSMAKK